MSTPPAALRTRLAAWLERWRSILPLLLAEFVVWLGFGALLPILPIYFRTHGIDFVMLGVVVAAWPAARLVAEPIFGWIADRTVRKPFLVGSLLVNAALLPLPLVFQGAAAFVLIRAATGLATAAYDPAARGFLVDATPRERRGEAFGLYGAAQMAGLLLGPAIGGVGASVLGDQAFVFVFGAVSSAVAGLLLIALVHERPLPRAHAATGIPPEGVTEMSAAGPRTGPSPEPPEAGAPEAGASEAGAGSSGRAPGSLANRLLVAAIVLNAGANYASGTYEVAWSLYLTSLGAGVGLVGATFAAFGVPVLLLSPLAGRLVDRRGSLPFIVAGLLMAAGTGVAYTLIRDPTLAIPIILVEASGLAFSSPALYAVVAAGSPAGRSSTAQGIFGAAGTIGFIISSLAAGRLAEVDLRSPFWTFSVVVTVALVVGLAIGWRSIRALRPAGAAPGDVPEPD